MLIILSGTWGVGLGNSHTPLDDAPVCSDFWGIRDNGDVIANETIIGKLDKQISEGDSIVSSYAFFSKMCSRVFIRYVL